MPLIYAGQRITATALSQDYAAGDTSTITVTATTFTSLSQAFTIPGGDAQVGDAYRLSAWGTGTWGSTPQGLGFQMSFAGTGEGNNFIGSGNLSASQPFAWEADILLQCQSTGVSGNWWYRARGTVTETNNTINVGTAGDQSVPWTFANGFVRDTTASSALVLQAKWGLATGAPTLTCNATMFEKLGG